MIELIEQCGKPFGIRDSHGFICFLTWPMHYPGQDARFAKEKEAAMNDIEAIFDALKKTRKEINLAKYPIGTDGVCGSCNGKDEDCALCETTGKVTLVL